MLDELMRLERDIQRMGRTRFGEDLGEDLFQEVCAIVLAYRKSHDCPTALILRIAEQQRALLYRKGKRRSHQQLPPDESTRDFSPRSDPASLLHQRELEKQIRTALDRLPPEQREVVIARIFRGESWNETALSVNATPETARTRLKKAKNPLRDWLKSYDWKI